MAYYQEYCKNARHNPYQFHGDTYIDAKSRHLLQMNKTKHASKRIGGKSHAFFDGLERKKVPE